MSRHSQGVNFSPGATSCAGCHLIEGRGRAIGPDLTGVWRMKPEQLLESIREPSKEIAGLLAYLGESRE